MWRQAASGRIAHRFEPLMFALALLVIPVVLIEESHAPGSLKTAAAVTNWVIWTGFAVEFVLILFIAPRKAAALRAHWLELGIVVLTPPFLPRLFSTLRLARLLRLLRVLRLGLLGSRALRAERALTREGFPYIVLATALMVIVAGAAISTVDTGDFANVWIGMWWAVVTVTTVGYGDVVPHSVAGRLVASVLMLVGIGFVALLTATVASAFIAHETAEANEERESDHDQVIAVLERIERRLEALESR